MTSTKSLISALIAIVGLSTQVACANTLLFAADSTNSVILKYDSQGLPIGQISNAELYRPTLLAATVDGRTLVTDINFTGPSGPDLIRVDMAGNTLARASSQSIFGIIGGGIISVVDTGRGTFLITSSINSLIAETDYAFKPIRLIATNTSSGGLRTLGIAMSRDREQFLVADGDGQSGSGFMRIFDYRSGSQQGIITDPRIIYPVDLAFAANGNLFISDRGATFNDDKILQFGTDSLFISQISSGASNHENFGQFDTLGDGRLFVLETNSITQTPLRLLSDTGGLMAEFGPDNARITDVLAISSVPEPLTVVLLSMGMVIILAGKRQA